MRVALIRHGATPGNALRRYVGARTDESLTMEACQGLVTARDALRSAIGDPNVLITSGMRRCRQTASLLFPGTFQEDDPRLREMDFGCFENRSFQDMEHDAAYRAWVEGGCEGAVSDGEDPAAFRARCVASFVERASYAAASGAACTAFVVHGGTIRAIISRLAMPPRGFFDVAAPSACCWIAEWPDVTAALDDAAACPALVGARLLEFPYDGTSVPDASAVS